MHLNVPIIPGIVLEQLPCQNEDREQTHECLKLQLRIKGFDIQYWLMKRRYAEQYPYRVRVTGKPTGTEQWDTLVQYEPFQDSENYPAIPFSLERGTVKEPVDETVDEDMEGSSEVVAGADEVEYFDDETVDELVDALREGTTRTLQHVGGRTGESIRHIAVVVEPQVPGLN